MKTRMLASLPIIAAGPIATVCLYETVEVSATACSLIIGVLIVSAVTAVVSTVAHLILKRPLLATVVSVPISEIICVLLLLAYIFCMSEGRGRAESFMWLPIIILFLIPFAFPTALSVSYGTGMIVRDFGERKSNRSRDFARRLVENDRIP